jgi:hypothetical protein
VRALPTGTALPAVGPGIPTILALERQPLTLGRVHRTTFTRQAANLGAVKAQLRQQLLGQVGFDPAISILDSFPMPVCRFGRADRCRRLAELASFGRDEGAKQTYYGLRASWDRWSLLAVVVELESRPSGGYRSPQRRQWEVEAVSRNPRVSGQLELNYGTWCRPAVGGWQYLDQQAPSPRSSLVS